MTDYEKKAREIVIENAAKGGGEIESAIATALKDAVEEKDEVLEQRLLSQEIMLEEKDREIKLLKSEVAFFHLHMNDDKGKIILALQARVKELEESLEEYKATESWARDDFKALEAKVKDYETDIKAEANYTMGLEDDIKRLRRETFEEAAGIVENVHRETCKLGSLVIESCKNDANEVLNMQITATLKSAVEALRQRSRE